MRGNTFIALCWLKHSKSWLFIQLPPSSTIIHLIVHHLWVSDSIFQYVLKMALKNWWLNYLYHLLFPVEKYLPIEIMYDGRMGYGCCWGPNEFPWTPYCIVDSPMTPYCMYDVPSINSTLSELSISSSEGDCCCSPESFVSSTPSSNSHKKVSRVEQQEAENIWRFPKTAPPPIPLPGWNPLP